MGQHAGSRRSDAVGNGEDRLETRSERATAKGTVKIAIANVIRLVSGLGLHVYLARTLEPQLYGTLAVVTSIIVWWELVGRALLIDSTTRFVAAAEHDWEGVAGTAIRVTAVWSLLLLVFCAATAPLTARVLRDVSLIPYLWLFSLDLALFPLYQTFLRILSGRRKYGYRAGAEIFYWLGKTLLMCGLVGLGLSVKGAIIGSIGASAVGLACAWKWSGMGWPRGFFRARELILFGLPLMGIVVLQQITQNMDLWCVKALLENEQAPGYYGAAKYLYRVSTILPTAVCGAMLPTLTLAISKGNQQSCRELIEQAFRFVFIILLLGIALVGSSAKDIVTLVFSAPYTVAAVPVILLIFAALMFALRSVAHAALIAAGKPTTCLLALAPLVPINIALNYFGVPRYGLVGAAAATGITGALAAGIMFGVLWREFRVLFDPLSLLRTSLAAGLVYGVGLYVPSGGVLVLPKLAGLAGFYLILLIVMGEIRRRDFEPLMFWRSGAAGGSSSH
ncbi:MAG: lipopolysaccharide biosynthesis protein [Gemmatimonadota bacterium]|nr:MAG: lipopolysaccharide biosynthesis protein [Gemmatimonadota bacterium]